MTSVSAAKAKLQTVRLKGIGFAPRCRFEQRVSFLGLNTPIFQTHCPTQTSHIDEVCAHDSAWTLSECKLEIPYKTTKQKINNSN